MVREVPIKWLTYEEALEERRRYIAQAKALADVDSNTIYVIPEENEFICDLCGNDLEAEDFPSPQFDGSGYCQDCYLDMGIAPGQPSFVDEG